MSEFVRSHIAEETLSNHKRIGVLGGLNGYFDTTPLPRCSRGLRTPRGGRRKEGERHDCHDDMVTDHDMMSLVGFNFEGRTTADGSVSRIDGSLGSEYNEGNT